MCLQARRQLPAGAARTGSEREVWGGDGRTSSMRLEQKQRGRQEGDLGGAFLHRSSYLVSREGLYPSLCPSPLV